MTQFSYSARDRNGKIVTGRLDAPNRQAVIGALRAEGKMPINIDSGRILLSHLMQMELTPQRFSLEERAGFFWQLSTYLEAGLGVAEALGQMARGSGKRAVADALEQAAQFVAEGVALDSAFAQDALAFDRADLALIGVGAKSGTLPQVLCQLAEQYEAKAERRAALISALIYPAILFSTAVGVVVLMMTVVVPEFEPIFAANGQELPWLTRLVRDASHGLAASLPYIALLIFLSVLLIVWALKRPTSRLRLHKASLMTPLVGELFRSAALARFARSVSLMLTGGVPLHSALALAAEVETNAAVAFALREAAMAVRGGSSLHEAIVASGLTAGEPLPLVELGERTGKLSLTLARLGDIIEREHAAALARIAAIATPALTLVMGGLIGTIVWAVMSAILDVNRLV